MIFFLSFSDAPDQRTEEKDPGPSTKVPPFCPVKVPGLQLEEFLTRQDVKNYTRTVDFFSLFHINFGEPAVWLDECIRCECGWAEKEYVCQVDTSGEGWVL